MTHERAALITAVRENPADRTARLVFADWLEEHDDPGAEYVRTEAELLAHERSTPEWHAAAGRLRDISARSPSPLGGWEFAADLTRIRTKIDELTALDTHRQVFGARWPDAGHEYVSNPPIPEPQLLDFELRHGVTLPPEYRAFLLRVGNGRVGPSYGILTLDPTAEFPRLRTDFAITPAEADSIAAAVRFALETKNWGPVPRFHPAWAQRGYLRLASTGCGNHTVIVVNGPMRGQLWSEGYWFVPHRHDGCSEGFLAWYESWLNRWLARGYIDRWGRAVGR
jgi:uncharacterized protein (TIGR02996 family)